LFGTRAPHPTILNGDVSFAASLFFTLNIITGASIADLITGGNYEALATRLLVGGFWRFALSSLTLGAYMVQHNTNDVVSSYRELIRKGISESRYSWLLGGVRDPHTLQHSLPLLSQELNTGTLRWVRPYIPPDPRSHDQHRFFFFTVHGDDVTRFLRRGGPTHDPCATCFFSVCEQQERHIHGVIRYDTPVTLACVNSQVPRYVIAEPLRTCVDAARNYIANQATGPTVDSLPPCLSPLDWRNIRERPYTIKDTREMIRLGWPWYILRGHTYRLSPTRRRQLKNEAITIQRARRAHQQPLVMHYPADRARDVLDQAFMMYGRDSVYHARDHGLSDWCGEPVVACTADQWHSHGQDWAVSGLFIIHIVVLHYVQAADEI
jgi:hypothetical protein